MRKTVLFAVAAAVLMVPAPAQALPTDSYSGALAGADRLLELQFDSGAFPWIVGYPQEYQNVQGITALGLMSAYEISLDAKYLGNATAGAQGNANWLADYMSANPGAFISSANIYFLTEYALFTGNTTAFELAQDGMFRALARFGSANALVDYILNARLNPYGSLGTWDVALFIRAASDLGWEEIADIMADRLATQTIVDPFDNTTNYYELGLAGLLFGLGEAGIAEHAETILQARDALLATQCESGAFPLTWQGVVYCDDVQSTAYGIIGLTWALETPVGTDAACSFLSSTQAEDGGWDAGGYEIAEVDSEAVVALQQCVVPANNGATSYVDGVRAALF